MVKCSGHLSLVRFPNAGKSTLLTAISNANPKIGDYACKSLFDCEGFVLLQINPSTLIRETVFL